MEEKRWNYIPTPDQAVCRSLVKELSVSAPLACILAQRSVSTFDEARRFFRPELSMLHDPFLMRDMDKAVDRLSTAISQGEKIMIYGDYDVDGTTSVALMYHFLRSFHADCLTYIPDREKEGYGVSKEGIERAVSENAGLIISLDCGIKSVDLVDQAKNSGIDFIICDHHRPGDKLPSAVAVLDPKRTDCAYPYKELSGCGVGFKLIQALKACNPGLPASPFDYLDLVAVSIASDIVPVTGENRVLAHFGLKKLKNDPRPGLHALMKYSGMEEVNMTNIVFRIAPRINSAGRIDHALAAAQLLITDDAGEADTLAANLQNHNQQRKDTDELITREALQMIEADEGMLAARSTVLFKQDWHKGVIGIVASRCIEKYYRPTVILARKSDDLVTGSARSVNGFDVYNALSSCEEWLEQFGGHRYAAGMTLREQNVGAFRKAFERVVTDTILEEQLTPEITIDTGLKFEEITPKFYRILKQMAPFGPENLPPVFSTMSLEAQNIRILKEKHLKLRVRQEGSTGSFDAIGFGLGHLAGMVQRGKFRMAYSLEENHYRGRSSLQLMIKDIKPE